MQLTAYGAVNAPGLSVDTTRCAVVRMAGRRNRLICSLIRIVVGRPAAEDPAHHMKQRSRESLRRSAKLLRGGAEGPIFT
jgi:hypothetical protein